MLRRLLLCLVVLALCLSGLLAPAQAKKKAARTTAAPAPAAQTVKAPRDALLAAADEISRQVSALRGLPIKVPLQKGVLSREEFVTSGKPKTP